MNAIGIPMGLLFIACIIDLTQGQYKPAFTNLILVPFLLLAILGYGFIRDFDSAMKDHDDDLYSAHSNAQTNEWILYKSEDSMCKSPSSGFEIRGDLDGNGEINIAKLQINLQKKKQDSSDFLELRSPGEIEPFVDSDDTTPIQVENSSVAYGTCEASEVVYYWDKKNKKV